MVTVTRKTTESSITVSLESAPVKKDYRAYINTPLPFLNHMIEHIVWRSGVNISVDVSLDKFDLTHVVCEDVGMTLGKAVNEYITKGGMCGFGDAVGIIDEARALCALSFEDRSGLFFDKKIDIPAETEGMYSEDLLTFLDGFVQGARCTMHVNVECGENGHHIWEAIYRAFGMALEKAAKIKPGREDMTAGVAGKVEYKSEVKS